MNISSIPSESTVHVRPSARVAAVAKLLDCHPTDIRRLIDTGDLEAHRKGVRGIRVLLDSVHKYQERRLCLPKTTRGSVPPLTRKAAPAMSEHQRRNLKVGR
jgi:excisionase family DNA binding protein